MIMFCSWAGGPIMWLHLSSIRSFIFLQFHVKYLYIGLQTVVNVVMVQVDLTTIQLFASYDVWFMFNCCCDVFDLMRNFQVQVNQRNVPGIDDAYLAMDTEEGVEVVWNEVMISERKNFQQLEVRFSAKRCYFQWRRDCAVIVSRSQI